MIYSIAKNQQTVFAIETNKQEVAENFMRDLNDTEYRLTQDAFEIMNLDIVWKSLTVTPKGNFFVVKDGMFVPNEIKEQESDDEFKYNND